MKKKIISFSLVTAGFLIGATALTALADWSAPNNAPPTCNGSDPGCLAPINVGPSDGSGLGQIKNDLLGLANLLVTNFSMTGTSGWSPQVGQVLGVTNVSSDGKIASIGLQTMANSTLSSLCNTVWVPPKNVTNQGYDSVTPINLVINGKNICTNDSGCTYSIWETSSNKPAGADFHTTSPIAFRQVETGQIGANNWFDASTNNTGVNGDSTDTTIDSWNNITLYDDWDSGGNPYYTTNTFSNTTGFMTNQYGSTIDVSNSWFGYGVGNHLIYGNGYSEHSPNYITAVNDNQNYAFIVNICSL